MHNDQPPEQPTKTIKAKPDYKLAKAMLKAYITATVERGGREALARECPIDIEGMERLSLTRFRAPTYPARAVELDYRTGSSSASVRWDDRVTEQLAVPLDGTAYAPGEDADTIPTIMLQGRTADPAIRPTARYRIFDTPGRDR